MVQNLMPLVSIATPGHNDGQVVAYVVGRIAEVTPHDYRRMIKQGSVSLGNLVHVEKKLIEVHQNIDLDTTQAREYIGITAVVRKRMPATCSARNFNGTVDPV